jgi:hypothetical protein
MCFVLCKFLTKFLYESFIWILHNEQLMFMQPRSRIYYSSVS